MRSGKVALALLSYIAPSKDEYPGREDARSRVRLTTSCFVFFPGGNSGEAIPVPIPNTVVKLTRANGTAGATLWESRTLPGS